MNILNITTDCDHGAGLAVKEFHRFLNYCGYNSVLVVKESEFLNQDRVIVLGKNTSATRFFSRNCRKGIISKLYYRLDLARIGPINPEYSFFNLNELRFAYSASEILNRVPFNPDVIIVHWVSWFVNSKVIADLQQQTKAKLYWVMLDNSPLTGGCHYSWECEGYKNDCSNCPAILKLDKKSISRTNLSLKKSNLQFNMDIIACSNNDYLKAQSSSIFSKSRIHKFILPVDEEEFFPSADRESLKAQFGIPNDAEKILLFGALSISEKRKGFKFLLSALQRLKTTLTPDEQLKIHIVILGRDSMLTKDLIPFNYSCLGFVPFQYLTQIFQLADVFVSPSIEDSGPLMINQSIMCGTPVVSFETGVAQDIVINDLTGYKVPLKDSEKLASGIYTVLMADDLKRNQLKKSCRDFAIDNFGFKASNQIVNSILNGN